LRAVAIADGFRAALASGRSLDGLRAAVLDELNAAVPRAEVIERLESIRPGLDESGEDIVLEVLDFVTGWSGPDARL
jgi:hypothetical protein